MGLKKSLLLLRMNSLRVNKKLLCAALHKAGINDPLQSNMLGEVYFMLSLRCNLRCKVCAWWGKSGPCRDKAFLRKYAPVLTMKDLMHFAAQILPYNPRRVTFSGGEPLFNKKWYYLARFFKENSVKVSLTTNGVFLSKEFERIIEVVDEVNLSLGGPPSILSLIRDNRTQHFKSIMQGLAKLSSFRENNNNKPGLRVLYTISGLSYKYMNELVEFMENSDIAIDRYHFQHLMFIDEPTFHKQKEVLSKEFNIKHCDLWRGYVFPPMNLDFDLFKKEVRRLKEMGNVSFSPDLKAEELVSYYSLNRGALRYNKYCTAPWHQIDIMPNGDIYTCHDLFIGNLRESCFRDIWNGKISRKLRLRLTQKLFPGCKGCFYHYSERNR